MPVTFVCEREAMKPVSLCQTPPVSPLLPLVGGPFSVGANLLPVAESSKESWTHSSMGQDKTQERLCCLHRLVSGFFKKTCNL